MRRMAMGKMIAHARPPGDRPVLLLLAFGVGVAVD